MQRQFLTPAQIEHFLSRGFIKLEGAVPREVALEWGATGWARLGYDPDDVSTWAQSRHHLPYQSGFLVRQHAPGVMKAARDLAGPSGTIPIGIGATALFLTWAIIADNRGLRPAIGTSAGTKTAIFSAIFWIRPNRRC